MEVAVVIVEGGIEGGAVEKVRDFARRREGEPERTKAKWMEEKSGDP